MSGFRDGITQVVHWSIRLRDGLQWLSPLADLAVRLWVAQVFWQAGMTKVVSPDSTIWLFQNEYAVPLLPPVFAAYLATFIELVFSAMLAFGLGGRFAAFVLFVFNFIAVISYPGLSPQGIEDHQVWGVMLLVPLLHGPGAISVDRLIAHFVCKRYCD